MTTPSTQPSGDAWDQGWPEPEATHPPPTLTAQCAAGADAEVAAGAAAIAALIADEAPLVAS